MKKETFVRLFLIGIIIAAMALMSFGCTTKSTPTASTSTSTTLLPVSTTTITSTSTNTVNFQQYKSLAVDFRAVITFSISNTTTSYPTELAVPLVPITWNGLSFSGSLQESGIGEDVTDTVNGTVSADGKALVQLVYSRQIMRSTATGTYYSVTLQSVPLNAGIIAGLFNFTGSSIQGYATAINYIDGPIVSGQINATTTYVSTDWGNAQPPTLSITFGM
jgi:hypothetical protein